MALSAAAVWDASHAAFTITADTAKGWSVTTPGLANDSTGPLFAQSNLTPGESGSKCLSISSTGTVPTTIKIFARLGTAVSNDVSPYINLTIQEGAGGTFASCSAFIPTATEYTGTLSTLTTTATSYATGEPGGSLPATGLPESLSYRITWTLSPLAPNSAQGGTTPSVILTWQSQNN